MKDAHNPENVEGPEPLLEEVEVAETTVEAETIVEAGITQLTLLTEKTNTAMNAVENIQNAKLARDSTDAQPNVIHARKWGT